MAWHLRWLVAAREVLATVLLAAATVALAGLLALHDADERALAAAAILWLVLAVAGLLAAGRLIGAEHGSGGLQGLLLAPVDRRDLFLSRALAIALVVFAMGAVTWILLALLFPDLAGLTDPRLAGPIAAGALGLGALGALSGWIALSTRAGELLAPILAIPTSAPLVIGGLHASQLLLDGSTGWEASLTFATGYALAVGAVSYIVSEHVVEVG